MTPEENQIRTATDAYNALTALLRELGVPEAAIQIALQRVRRVGE